MTKKETHLKLIKKPKELKEQSEFFRSCPRLLTQLPEEVCNEGKSSVNSEDPPCPWWINSKEHHFCFWRFVEDKSDIDGAMPILTQSQISKLMNWSDARTNMALKEAMEELKAALIEYKASELLEALNDNVEDSGSVPRSHLFDESFE